MRGAASRVGARVRHLPRPSAAKRRVSAFRGASRLAPGASVVARAISDPPADSKDVDAESGLGKILRSNSGGLTKILCANRGEIAVRVFRAGTELGMNTVAIFSEADRLATHRYKADESYCVNPGETPVGAYLGFEGIIDIAKAHGVQAIHPGYGFLSENAAFAKRCEEEGIAWVGPRSETIMQMGDKVIAKQLAKECGLPLVPGTEDSTDSVEEAQAFAEEFGMPIMLKAAFGGGGRGMRVVRTMSELPEAFTRASSEALAAFGDGRMFLERYVEAPRHIEVQILADGEGNVVHLAERDCSVQRRHQKVVELAPAAYLDDELRKTLHDDAVRLAKHVNYRNAGTVEFMVDKEGRHYFLEVNPRIQVEHTVTEEVTGIDLVQSQLLIAGGATLADLGIESQADVTVQGFAMQCRITTEDPQLNFTPDFGKVEVYRPPGGMGVRLDGEVVVGSRVSPNYDSLLVKLTCKEQNFPRVIQKMYRALSEFRVRGVKTNIPFLLNVLQNPDVSQRPIRDGLHRLHAEPVRPRDRVGRHDEAPDVPRRGRGERREAPGARSARAHRRRADAAQAPRPGSSARRVQADSRRARPERVRQGGARPRGVADHGHDVARRAPVRARDPDAHAGSARVRARDGGGAQRRVLARDVGRGDVRRLASVPARVPLAAARAAARGGAERAVPDAPPRRERGGVHVVRG